jgi:hypothetical protein
MYNWTQYSCWWIISLFLLIQNYLLQPRPLYETLAIKSNANEDPLNCKLDSIIWILKLPVFHFDSYLQALDQRQRNTMADDIHSKSQYDIARSEQQGDRRSTRSSSVNDLQKNEPKPTTDQKQLLNDLNITDDEKYLKIANNEHKTSLAKHGYRTGYNIS